MTRRRAVAAPTPPTSTPPGTVVAERLAPTPLVPAPALGDDVHLKLEMLQPTGSFKVRGALAALSRAGGGPVITASAGNAGLGIAWAAATLGVDATVVVAETASPAKIAALRALPVTLIAHGGGYDEAEAHALELAARGAAYVSSYNDTGVIAGQSTIGRELDAQLAAPPAVACPLGGGSLASGLGLWAAERRARPSSRSRPSARPRSRRRSRRGRSRRSRWGRRSPTAWRGTSSPAR